LGLNFLWDDNIAGAGQGFFPVMASGPENKFKSQYFVFSLNKLQKLCILESTLAY